MSSSEQAGGISDDCYLAKSSSQSENLLKMTKHKDKRKRDEEGTFFFQTRNLEDNVSLNTIKYLTKVLSSPTADYFSKCLIRQILNSPITATLIRQLMTADNIYIGDKNTVKILLKDGVHDWDHHPASSVVFPIPLPSFLSDDDALKKEIFKSFLRVWALIVGDCTSLHAKSAQMVEIVPKLFGEIYHDVSSLHLIARVPGFNKLLPFKGEIMFRQWMYKKGCSSLTYFEDVQQCQVGWRNQGLDSPLMFYLNNNKNSLCWESVRIDSNPRDIGVNPINIIDHLRQNHSKSGKQCSFLLDLALMGI